MKEPQFTPGPWRRTITTVPCVTEGYDTSPDIVNLTIDNMNIPLAVLAMNSTKEMRECFGKMVAKRHRFAKRNARLIAHAPELYAKLDEVKDCLPKIAKDEVEKLLARATSE